jgi:hypothetical protein
MGANKNIIICSEFHKMNYTKSNIKFLEPTQNNHDIGLALDPTLNQRVNTILFQVTIGL